MYVRELSYNLLSKERKRIEFDCYTEIIKDKDVK